MTNQRHHEVSPGGDDLTHREHYGKESRRENRFERREARRNERIEFKNKRDNIREEIDFSNARLPRRLKIRLAELEELIAQHELEGLEYESQLRGFNEIKVRVDALGDDTDEGAYEEGGKTSQKNIMQADLQKLREIIRGLRTSLRRHVNHIEDEVEAHQEEESTPAGPPSTEANPRQKERSPRSGSDDEEDDTPVPTDPRGADSLSRVTIGVESPEEKAARRVAETAERSRREEQRQERIREEEAR